MHLFALGLNHHSAPLAVRERLAFDTVHLPQALRELCGGSALKEAAILSTCNRTELYCAVEQRNGEDSAQSALRWLADYHRLADGEIAPYLYTHPRGDAVRHVFRVASGLDSMVLGEPQILGQMKQAVRAAEAAGTLGTLLGKLFQNSFSVAKEVRSTTAIGANIVSMAAAAVHLSARIFERMEEQRVLFIGAGEMIELCVAHFAAANPRAMTIVNRTLSRAEALAGRVNAQALALSELATHLPAHDIIVTCTASTLPILGLGLLERALKVRRHKPMVIVDLAVPRDTEAEIARLSDVFLYTLDDLGQIVERGLESRQSAVLEAEAIIDERVTTFLRWIDARGVVPTIRRLREKGAHLRDLETAHALKMLQRGDDPKAVLAALAQGLTNKLLHAPTLALNQANGEEREQLASLVTRLYKL